MSVLSTNKIADLGNSLRSAGGIPSINEILFKSISITSSKKQQV